MNYLKLIITLSLCFLVTGKALSDELVSKENQNYLKDLEKEDKSLAISAMHAMDNFLNRAGLKLAINNAGLRGNSASKVESIVRLALKNISGTEKPDRESIIRGLSVVTSGSDKRIKDNLIKIFQKKQNELTDTDFVNAVNALVFLAGRYGLDNSLALACSACVGGNLAKKGFLISYEQITDKQTSFILKNVIPTDTRELGNFIGSRLKRLGLRPQGRQYYRVLNSADEKNFALFLSIPDHGTNGQKALFTAIKKISEKANGEIDILDSNNSHKLWRLYSSNLNDLELKGWSDLLEEVAKDAKAKGEVNKKAAFLRYFESRVGDDPKLARRYEVIKSKNCFFN